MPQPVEVMKTAVPFTRTGSRASTSSRKLSRGLLRSRRNAPTRSRPSFQVVITASISDASKAEGKKNQATLFSFTVTLSAIYDQPATLSYQTTNGTATTSDQDYVSKTGTLTFAPGETIKTITIEVKGDGKKEADETFFLDLFGNSLNSVFTRKRGTGTILNDD